MSICCPGLSAGILVLAEAEESMWRLACLQNPQISSLELVEAESPYRIQYDSARQSLPELLMLEKDFCLSIIFQSIEYSLSSSLSEWIYLHMH